MCLTDRALIHGGILITDSINSLVMGPPLASTLETSQSLTGRLLLSLRSLETTLACETLQLVRSVIDSNVRCRERERNWRNPVVLLMVGVWVTHLFFTGA